MSNPYCDPQGLAVPRLDAQAARSPRRVRPLHALCGEDDALIGFRDLHLMRGWLRRRHSRAEGRWLR